MNCKDFSFIRRLVPVFDRLKAEKGVDLFHEHSAFWAYPNVSDCGHTLCLQGFEWVKRDGCGKPGFLKRVRSGKDLSRVEILADSLTPEHEAFAVKSHLGFKDAFEKLKAEPGFTHLPEFDHFEDGFKVVMFRVDGFDTALQLIFRNHDGRIFEPSQVFDDE